MKAEAIVYTSNTGYTARYAALLAEQTHLPCWTLQKAPAHVARGAEILYLGWLCAGGIKGLKKARSLFKVPAVCAVGMSPDNEAYTAKLAKQNRLEDIPLFYLRGGYAPSRLTGVYKPVMAIMGKVVGRTPAKTAEQQAMLDAFAHGGDWISGEQLAPVLALLK